MKKLSGAEIRQTYIDFFVERGHTAVPSSSLVPGGDATLLFTNSGMVQFKDVFLSTDKRTYTRAVDSQKCMRVAGKHNDLEDVGRDDTHHTFFEMLGNWSFGDYYKKEAIQWAWQLLTDVWGLPKEHLYATVFEDDQGNIPSDEEAAENWRKQPGFDPQHLYFMGRKDNFWEMADTGPCGPCSEIHFDMHPENGLVTKEILETGRFVELWNLVFIQYNRTGVDHLDPLPATHVDTGMGFERLVSILQGVDSNYKTDLFIRSLDVLRSLTGASEQQVYQDFTPYRVICDHARAAAFLIADGVVPGNTGRNYVCRMIIRRAARFGSKVGLTEPFLARVAEAVLDTYGSFYTELEKSRQAILDNLTREEIRFARTVEAGETVLLDYLDKINAENRFIVEGTKAFELYATYGLPLEITRDIALERQSSTDTAGFEAAMDEHRLASGGGRAMGALGGEDAEFYAGIFKDLRASGKLGQSGVDYDPYTSTRVEGEVLALVVNGRLQQSASFGDTVEVILPKTGFYIESGGQVSDTGFIRGNQWEIEVSDVRKPSAGVIVHIGEVISGQLKVGDTCVAEVELSRRHDIMRNHTATHLLHAALHQVLGEHARQAGSLVAPDRLRFDFNHPEAMTPEQIERVERMVNEAVAADMAVMPKLKAREQAIAEGATALFGEKYGETVRTITIAPLSNTLILGRKGVPAEAALAAPTFAVEQQEKYSYELCGGTHLERTSDVGAFIIVSEGSAAAGVRRIEALTGRGAYDLIARNHRTLKKTAVALKSSLEELPQKVESLQAELAELRKELAVLRAKSAVSTFDLQLSAVRQVKGANLLATEIPGLDEESLRMLADKFREKYPTDGVCVVITSGDSIRVMASVTQDLVKKGVKAGELVGHLSSLLGAKGGGAPHLAIGGGKDASKIGEALESVEKWLQTKLK